MNATREMPKYECHKKVWALKIAGIVGDQHGGVYFQPAEEGYDKVPMSPEYVAKHKPFVGGYYVVYEDGYKSFSPAGAFESGYARIDGQHLIRLHTTENEMSNEFKQEDRYIVFKVSDLGNSLKGDAIRKLAEEYAEQRKLKGKEPLKCVVVESDWPEYEPTWKAIEARVTDVQPAPSIPEGWLRAIDEALVVAHIGVASKSDTYEQAKAKLNNLIGFHVDVATDPAVNGGWKLVPIEPTETFYQCFSAYDGTAYSNPFDYDDFVKDWREALAAAPEAKP